MSGMEKVHRLMDQMQQEQSTSDTTIQSGQHVQNTHGCQTDHIAPVVSPTGAWGKIPGVSSMQAAGLHSQVSDYVQSELVNAGSTSVLPLNISRPRPTALGNKLAGKTSRIPETYVKEKPSIPAFVTDLHSPISQSLTEPSQLPHSPQSPFSRQPYSVQPYLSPQASLAQPPPNPTPPSSLSPKARLSPQPQKTIGGALVENQPQVDKTCKESEGFKIHIVTWNVGSAVPPDDITSLFGPSAADCSVDMFIIGLQEVNSMINKRLKDALFTDQWSELCMDTLSCYGYVLVASQRMQGVLLLVFSKFCHLPFLQGVQTESTRTGLGGYWGNKGGVSARMAMFGHPVCFLNCHLPAHMRNLEQRMEDFESILQQQQFEGGTATGVLDHDVLFWFGDLNFRIEDYDIHVVKSAIDSNKLPLLWERDQLNMAKNSESILEGFNEGPLNFPPTYKFDVGTHTYDTSGKKRKPAWTDRILWRRRRTGSPVPSHNAALQRGLTLWLGGATRVTHLAYRSHMGYTISDHKPVSALFALHFPFRVDIPLVAFEKVDREWTNASEAIVRFTVASTYQRSSWDWVAIYKLGFKHHKDYVAYVWAKGEHLTQVIFAEEDLPRDAGEYILGYYSNNMNSIVGVTSAFKIQIPVRSPTVCCSDSSDASSEDNSTLVLLAPNSRSPSPGTGKHRRYRRSRSPAVPTLSTTPLSSLQGLSLCPHPRDAHSHSHSPFAAAKKERLMSPDTLPSPTISPLSPRSPVSPGGGVTAPEALIAAILGEHSPNRGIPAGKVGKTSL
ncbi:inositol polyphosphate 5-phosphatase K [Hypomesus transpacificus]|uniref:inositol polyphosphate 5-phosphatase K n=1 Tax=Hypomesus transpacificus TaxID=137520 RepID=UPI001F080732|nr:inositol polyphosphate 5-phosphatase K [Hypomesus transpacificus]